MSSFAPSVQYIQDCETLYQLMAAEGRMASYYFSALYENYNWKTRIPRAKIDYLNSLLDIGYTFLFNFIEGYARLFGFDLYVGVLHQLWFQRKSLVCDLQEPFRCIIDHSVFLALQKDFISETDFRQFKGSYYLKPESRAKISKFFYEEIIQYKMPIYKYIQGYYRNFMKESDMANYPKFILQ